MYIEDGFRTPDKVEVLYISPKQAAARYGISPDMVRLMTHMEGFPDVMKVGRKICIPMQEFDEFMETTYRIKQPRHSSKSGG